MILKIKSSLFSLLHNFFLQVLIFQMKVGYVCVCVRVTEREKERDFIILRHGLFVCFQHF